MTIRTCGVVGEKAQVILVWKKASFGVGNASYPRRLGVTKVKPRASCSSWHLDSIMFKISSIESVS